MAKKHAKRRKKGKSKRANVASERAYDAALSTPARRNVIGADGSQDAQADGALGKIRNWGRYLDENHDVASGVLDELVKNIVGSGIVTVPKPLREDGSIDDELAIQILDEWIPWTRRVDVTGELPLHEAQRLMCRGWLRDGEQFVQHVTGRMRGYPFGPMDVPYRVELIESDLVPWDLSEDGWRQGIRHDTWRRPSQYAVYLEHPGDLGFLATPRRDEFKVVAAEAMTHLKVVKRWPATRGISLFSTVISRLYDVKDLEESERIKNRLLASWVAAIIKSPDLPGTDDSDASGKRYVDAFQGTVIDSLAPGETISGVGPDYPVADMPDHIADQMRRVASGTGTRYSSIAKRYDGNYAAQRQELVESEGHYQMREDSFVAKVCRTMYERFLLAAVTDGKVIPGPGWDIRRLANAEYRGPVTPWIDPLKEVQADALAVSENFVTREQIQIKRGASPEIIGEDPAPDPVRPVAPPVALVEDEEDEEDEAA